MLKKQIPLKLLGVVEPFLKEYSDCVTVVQNNDCYYSIKDIDDKSVFCFNIYIQMPIGVNITGRYDFIIERSPESSVSTAKQFTASQYANLGDMLRDWGNKIRKYNLTDSVFDDPILNAYHKEFQHEFQILDEDANYTPFNQSQLLLLDSYLENVYEGIEKYKDAESAEFVEEIKADIILLRTDLTKYPKNIIMKRITATWAKMQKQGIKYIKEFVSTAKKELMKAIIKGGIDKIPDLLN